MLNPLSLVTPLILIFFSIPLAVFAGITTSLAIAVLLVRATIVYLELAAALTASYLVSSTKKPTRDRTTPHPLLTTHSSARSSAASLSSNSPATKRRSHLSTRSESAVLIQSPYPPRRDYEGVGGWRTLANSADEEALWMGMNKRLELPAAATNETQKRNHKRSLTAGSGGARGSGSWSPGSTWFATSPNTSRPRTRVPTPAAEMGVGAEGYFALTPKERSVASGHANAEIEAARLRRLSVGTGSTGSSSTIGSTKSAIKITKSRS